MASLVRVSNEILFDGNAVDLDRVLAHVHNAFVLNASQFSTDTEKCAFLSSFFRGAALDWYANECVAPEDQKKLSDYDGYVKSIRSAFGCTEQVYTSAAQTELQALRQAGEYADLRDLLVHFEFLCGRAGIHSDASRVTILQPKLNSYYGNAWTTAGFSASSYAGMKGWLLRVYSRTPSNGAGDEVKRSKARCKVCGKRGHTGSQCKAKN